MNQLFFCAIIFFVSFLMAYCLWRFPSRYFLDKAGDRSLHAGIVPRSGGIAILASFAIACAAGGLFFLTPVLSGALILLCAISLWDDVKSLPHGWRLLVQLLACGLVVFGGQLYIVVWDGMPLLISRIVTLLGLVWMINLYNFMDGMDGFASGM